MLPKKAQVLMCYLQYKKSKLNVKVWADIQVKVYK